MSTKNLVYLADLSYFNKFSNQQVSVPLNVGYIASYAESIFPGQFEFKLFKRPELLIENMHSRPPGILGLSCYYWNDQVNFFAAKTAKQIDPSTIVVAGGPEIGSSVEELDDIHERFNGNCDFYVLNEGELAFCSFLSRYLECGPDELFSQAIDGGAYIRNSGPPLIGMPTPTIQVDTIPSPILSGLLDEFLTAEFMPMIQTTRLCPYTCTFCHSGIVTGKLRKFSLERVKEEIDYIADKYRNFPHRRLCVADDNFGIFKEDTEIAKHFTEAKEKFGYPQQLYLYYDKKFKQGCRDVAKYVANMGSQGVVLAFQSLNQDALKAIKRINLNDAEIDNIIEWVKENNFQSECQLIMGLPLETKKSFLDAIEYLVQKKIDSVAIFPLMLLGGTELNLRASREKYQLKSKWRSTYMPSYMELNGEFIFEAEEVVVSTSTMSFDDYLAISRISLVSYLLTTAQYYKRIVDFLVQHTDVNITRMFDSIMNIDNPPAKHAKEYRSFIEDFNAARSEELYDTYEEARDAMQADFINNGNVTVNPSRLNVLFASRLIYKDSWFGDVFRSELKKLDINDDQSPILDDLMEICDGEWIDLSDLDQVKDIAINPKSVPYIFSSLPANSNNGGKLSLRMKASEQQKKLIESLLVHTLDQEGLKALYDGNALDYVHPRRKLRFEKMDLIQVEA